MSTYTDILDNMLINFRHTLSSDTVSLPGHFNYKTRAGIMEMLKPQKAMSQIEQIKALQEENERLRKELQALKGEDKQEPYLAIRKSSYVNKPNFIMSACLLITGGKREYLHSKSREREHITNRQIYAWFLWRYTELSLQNIAQRLNGCDHATVINSLHKFVDLYQTDREYKRVCKKINAIISGQIKVNRHRLPTYYNIIIEQ